MASGTMACLSVFPLLFILAVVLSQATSSGTMDTSPSSNSSQHMNTTNVTENTTSESTTPINSSSTTLSDIENSTTADVQSQWLTNVTNSTMGPINSSRTTPSVLENSTTADVQSQPVTNMTNSTMGCWQTLQRTAGEEASMDRTEADDSTAVIVGSAVAGGLGVVMVTFCVCCLVCSKMKNMRKQPSNSTIYKTAHVDRLRVEQDFDKVSAGKGTSSLYNFRSHSGRPMSPIRPASVNKESNYNINFGFLPSEVNAYTANGY